MLRNVTRIAKRLFGGADENQESMAVGLAEGKMPMAAVTIYTTLFCPYCSRAKQLLSSKGVDFEEIPVDIDPARRSEMVARANGEQTVPQIFVNDQHIGGSDELADLDRAGQLDPLLAASS